MLPWAVAWAADTTLAEEMSAAGRHDLAWLEYMRLAVAEADPARSAHLRRLAAETLLDAGAWKDAADAFARGATVAPGAAPAFLLGEAESRYRMGDLEGARRGLATVTDGELVDDVTFRRAWIGLRAGDRAGALADLALVPPGPLRAPSVELAAAIAAAPPPRVRSPGVAGVLSAVVPGAGQLYAGAPLDAAAALALTGACAAGTLALGRDGEWVSAGVVGTLGVSLYAGNILSATQAARRTNQRASQRQLDAWSAWEATYRAGALEVP